MSKLHHFLRDELMLPHDLIDPVAQQYETVTIPKDEYLVKEGQYCHNMCFISEGYFRFYTHSHKKVITHWIFGEGQLVTDVASFFLKEPAKWNIQALTEMKVQMISLKNYEIIQSKYLHWERYEKLMLVRLMSALENRVYALLSMNSEERYHYLFNSDPKMFNQLPLQYLA